VDVDDLDVQIVRPIRNRDHEKQAAVTGRA